MSYETDRDTNKADDRKTALVKEAKKRWQRCDTWESNARKNWLEDYKFYYADAYNMYQWPQNAQTARGFGTGDEKPCLTVNKTKQHVLQIVNDMRQNKTSVKIKPVGNEATYEAAQIYEGAIRAIEYRSNAQAHYITATRFQVIAGLGYLKVKTAYVDDDTFDQELLIEAMPDPLMGFMDPDSVEPDGRDMRFFFEYTDMPRDEFDLQYPAWKNRCAHVALENMDGWIDEKHVRVAGYWYRNEIKDKLVEFTNPQTGAKSTIKKSETRGWTDDLKEALEEQLDDPETRTRDIIGHEVKWCRIIGNEVAEEKDWPGSTIPIVPMVGEKTVIDGEMDRRGHVRSMLDAQRMLNYNRSASIEYGALQTKTPWLAGAMAIEGQDSWASNNLDNFSVIVFNDRDDEGQPIHPPTKLPPPSAAPVYIQGSKDAADDMMAVSGQYQPVLGEPSNERSGKAIQERQRQGENATYHFIDHQAISIRRVGEIIMEVYPNIYDTKRTIEIMGEDGTNSRIMLDPDAKQAYEKRKAETDEAAEQVIMNPNIGKYDVISDVGPDFATRRQEAFNALSQIAAQDPQLMSIIGDLVMLAADFPLADEAAERLRRMVPPQALGDVQNPQVAQLQAQLGAMGKLNEAMTAKLIEKQTKMVGYQEKRSVDEYKAVTDRLKIWLDHNGIPAGMQMQFLHDLAMQEHEAGLGLVDKTIDASLQAAQNDTQEAA